MTIQSWKINIMIHSDAKFKNDFCKLILDTKKVLMSGNHRNARQLVILP